jgi:hypothetical protein
MHRPKQLNTYCGYWLVVAAVGMLLSGMVGESMAGDLVRRWPLLFQWVVLRTPSIHNLTDATAQGSTLDLPGYAPLFAARAASVLYAMAGWASLCAVSFAIFGILGALRAERWNPQYNKIKATYAGMLVIVLIVCALLFMARYPFESALFLRREGILRNDPFWWSKAFYLLAACTLGIMMGTDVLLNVVIKKLRDDASH